MLEGISAVQSGIHRPHYINGSYHTDHAPEYEFDELGPHVVMTITLGAVVRCIGVALNPLALDLSDANILWHRLVCMSI